MALDAGQIAECKEIAREIIKEVLELHVQTCPHHASYLIVKARTMGIAIGIIVASGVSSGTAVAIIMKLMEKAIMK